MNKTEEGYVTFVHFVWVLIVVAAFVAGIAVGVKVCRENLIPHTHKDM